jgi:hypothetical protein
MNIFYRLSFKDKEYFIFITMSNRIHNLIRRFLQNSGINREKFVNNKQIYKESIIKNRQQNYNKIVVRKMSTYIPNPSYNNDGNNGNKPPNNDYKYLIIISIGVFLSNKYLKK